MKHLKLFEGFNKVVGSKINLSEISQKEFTELISIECAQFSEIINNSNLSQKNKFLFRKFDSNYGDFLFTDPKESPSHRIAPWSECGNWHNLIISNLPSWRNYPRRNRSMICAGWERSVQHNGSDLYLVIPFDRTKIGVCKNDDFWTSFNVKSNINRWIFNVIERLDTELGYELKSDNDWESLLPYLNRRYSCDFFYGYKKNDTLLNNLDSFLNPNNNEFKLETFSGVSTIQKNNCRECWFEDPAILVRWKYLIDNPIIFPGMNKYGSENWIQKLKNLLK